MQTAPLSRRGANDGKDDGTEPHRHATTAPRKQALLIAYSAARARLDATVDLLDQALDLRELLYCGIDMDDARAMVADLRRRAAEIARRQTKEAA